MTKKSSPLVGIAGNIGVGKTTLTTRLAERLGWQSYYESVIDNPYLSDFYGDMSRWSFNLQIYFLAHRFRSQTEIFRSNIPAVQDRTIYEDVEIFARSLYEQKYMSEQDYSTYCELFQNMVEFLPKPDVIIYLQAPVDVLLQRIASRGRDYEKSIKEDYLTYLNTAYDEWIARAKKDFTVLTLDAVAKDFLNGDEDLDELIVEIKKICK